MTKTVQALHKRGWKTKGWTTRRGRVREGGRWTKGALRTLLTNPVHVGRVRLRGEIFDGEHPAILDAEVFERAQALLAEATHKPGVPRGGRRGTALLAGLLHCAPCNASMSPSWTKRRGTLYRYYVCRTTKTEGWGACPSPSVPAHEIETLVVEQIRTIGRDRDLQARVLDQVRRQDPEVNPADLRRALTLFDPVWEVLHVEEQARVMRLLVEGVAYDGAAGTVTLSFREGGIQALAEEVES